MNMTDRSALVAIIACAGWSQAALTQSLAPQPEILTLSDAEKSEIISHNAHDADTGMPPLAELAPRPSSQIHGQFGAMIGSNGTRAAYGSAAFPLGQHAGASVSFETGRFGWYR
jgi:hypothetical protein